MNILSAMIFSLFDSLYVSPKVTARTGPNPPLTLCEKGPHADASSQLENTCTNVFKLSQEMGFPCLFPVLDCDLVLGNVMSVVWVLGAGGGADGPAWAIPGAVRIASLQSPPWEGGSAICEEQIRL